MDWVEYQAALADLLRSLGFDVEVEALVAGARARHKIDVWATFQRFGLQHQWAVECKLWKARVSKREALAFKGVVDDVGADKGLLLSESGFQRGAITAVAHTNAMLLSFAELRSRVKPDFLRELLDVTTTRMTLLQDRYVTVRLAMEDELYWLEETGVDVGATALYADYQSTWEYADFAMIHRALENGRLGKLPAAVGIDDHGEPVFARDLETLLDSVSGTLDRIEGRTEALFSKYDAIIKKWPPGSCPPRLSPWHELLKG